jgi:hypothetical protein
MRRPLLVAWAVAVVLIGGCRLRPSRPLPPVSAAELLRDLAARRAAVGSLRARARLRAGLSGLWVREAILVRRPDAVRIDVLSPFGLALALGLQGPLLWAYPPAQGTRYEGAATPANMARFLGAPVAGPDIVDLLLGVPPARRPIGPPTLDVTRDREYRVTLPLVTGTQTIWFDGDTRVVRRAEETAEGDVALRVTFDDYEDGFPHALAVEAAGGAAARLAYEGVEANAAVDPSAFAPPPASRILPLEAAPAPDAR